METTDHLKANWPSPGITENRSTQNGDRLIARADGGRSYVAPATKLNPHK